MVASAHFKVGDLVMFGRINGERTLARIVKLNPKRAKVVTLEVRGHGAGSAVGTTWNVQYGALKSATTEDAKRASPAAESAGPHPVGLRITKVRPMTPNEMEAEGWTPGYMSGTPMVFVLSDGTLIYASRDSEGNGPGVLFGKHPDKGAVAFA